MDSNTIDSPIPPDSNTINTDSLTPKKETKRGKNANSLANLRMWKKGESGNPSGISVVKEIVDPLEIKNALYLAFKEVYGNGIVNNSRLIKYAKNSPVQFLRLIAQVMPKDLEIRGKVEGNETRILIVHNGEQSTGEAITIKGEEVVSEQGSEKNIAFNDPLRASVDAFEPDSVKIVQDVKPISSDITPLNATQEPQEGGAK